MKVLIVLAVCLAACFADQDVKYEIPEPFKWDESFQVFYERLDEEHKGLFRAIFDVSDHPANATVLKHLVDVIDAHFEYEEGEMKKASYEGFEDHHKIHEAFQKKLHEGHVPVSTEQIHKVKDWLVNHIKGTDFKYKGKLL